MKGKGLGIRLEDCVDLFRQDVLEVLLGIICIPSAPSKERFSLDRPTLLALEGFKKAGYEARTGEREEKNVGAKFLNVC